MKKKENGNRELPSRLQQERQYSTVLSATITTAVYSTLIMRTRPGELGAIVWGNTHVEIGVLGSIFTATNGNGSAGLLMRSNWVCLFCLDGGIEIGGVGVLSISLRCVSVYVCWLSPGSSCCLDGETHIRGNVPCCFSYAYWFPRDSDKPTIL